MSLSLETFTLETFTPHLGSVFTITFSNGETLPLHLEKVNSLGSGVPGGRAPFSLLFRHPPLPNNAYLPQHIHHLEHAMLGSLELFLVPLGPDSEGMRYEAIFT
jgi:hypothetical protein